MPWNKQSRARAGPGIAAAWCLLFSALGVALWLQPAAIGLAAGEEKQLTVYFRDGSFTLPVYSLDKQDYVDLYAVLQPMATTVLKLDGKRALLNVNGAELELNGASDRARVRQTRLDLSSRVIVEGGRPMVALADLTTLVARALGETVNFHETGRRFFVGNTGAQFSATLKSAGEGQSAAALVLSFPMPVSPRVSTEGNRLRMQFQREPVLAGSENVRYNDPLITGLSYAETNGAAEVIVSGTAPLLASFSDNGRSITVSAAPGPPNAVAKGSEEHPASPAEGAATPVTPSSSGETPQQTSEPAPDAGLASHVQVVIDPAHGGADSGERFNDNLVEKDLNLALARKLRAELQQRGISAVLLRDSDRALSAEDRSIATNTQRPALYLAIHTSGLGAGIRLNADLITPSSAAQSHRFTPWNQAQTLYAARSRRLATTLAANVSSQDLAATAALAPVTPLDRLACPALAVEIAPQGEHQLSELSSSTYQQSVAAALARSIAGVFGKVEAH